jgi:hypothetical protein
MTRIAFVLFFSSFWFLNQLSAQEKDSIEKAKIDFSVLEPKIRFCSKNELSGLIGISKVKDGNDYILPNPEWGTELTSTNGIQYGSFFAGIGTGVRTLGDDFVIPLFLHVSLDVAINKKVKGFFLCADLGNQFVDRQNSFGDKETGSFFAAYGLGYNFNVAKRMKLYLKANVIHQRAKAEDKHGGLGPSTYQEYYGPTYLFLRISVGLRFIK